MTRKESEIHPATVEAIEARTDAKIEKAISRSDLKLAELRGEMKVWFLATTGTTILAQFGLIIALFSLFGLGD